MEMDDDEDEDEDAEKIINSIEDNMPGAGNKQKV